MGKTNWEIYRVHVVLLRHTRVDDEYVIHGDTIEYTHDDSDSVIGVTVKTPSTTYTVPWREVRYVVRDR